MGLFFRRQEREWSVRDVAQLVRTHQCFSSLNLTEATRLVEHMSPQRVRSGTILFHEGQQQASFMALILQGEATAEAIGGGHGEPVMLKLLQEGDLIGEQGILDNAARSATVTAASDMSLAAMSQSQFNKLTRAHPAIGCKILLSVLRTVSNRLRDSNKRLHMLSQLNRTMNEELDQRSTPKLRPAPGEDTVAFRAPQPGA